MKKAILLSLGVGLLTAGLSLLLQTRFINVESFFAARLLSAPVATATSSGQGGSFEMPGKPVRLRIPAIGVDANIQSVGLAWQGTGDMGIPTNFTDVGWYNGGPRPGMPGSAVIDGHLDGHDVKEAVFYNLSKLQKGDVVEVVDTQGTVLRFKVTKTALYDYTATTTEVFSNDTSTSRLNLITCAGDWDKQDKVYSQRVVVFTELVKRGSGWLQQ